MIIREYKPEDKEGIEKCSFELQELEKELDPEMRINSIEINRAYVELLLDKMEKRGGQIFVADQDHKIAGFISIAHGSQPLPYENFEKYIYVYDVVVLSEFRKQGIGERLMNRALDFGKEQKADHIILDVLAKNKVAADFYRKRGFREGSISMLKKLDD
ncbi:MAG: GCN5-related N-acetyltransferase [Candidatus Yanofskybacteria bacterium GW2011_GWA1_48_10]|uniref:GCN5-related N-acetyltransferase n=2 Tax=Candidatus Yanofskyibacteriota TaxID=1752733 RepID=A0A0G1U7P8_9BACT|nr:MAG: GCN5-related N-acetyltransferase [Candidatus Yanofskybacteria bacterium GW2011_GWA1_48_10]OGN06569.1 MAG: hypothetical protein A2669_02915 [Candidatus Yanofskybacteria bacterium RIFCSPHIGHO2_01_FULL_48_25b]